MNCSRKKSGSRRVGAEEDGPEAKEKGGRSEKEGWLKLDGKDRPEGGGVLRFKKSSVEKKVEVG